LLHVVEMKAILFTPIEICPTLPIEF
jgi:hypothetical protein